MKDEKKEAETKGRDRGSERKREKKNRTGSGRE